MKMPNKYKETSAGGFTPPALGGHICVIKEVTETTSKNGQPQIIVYYDFAPDDSQPRYFENQFRDDIRPEKKWPYAGTAWINVEDRDGNCSRSFKQFTTSFERSNDVELVWGQAFANQFPGKMIGAVYGEKQHEYNGKVSMRHERFWFCDANVAQSADIPPARYKDGTQSAPVAPGAQTDVFAPSVDEELPFA